MALTDELKEVIASASTDYTEVEVVKLSYSLWDAELLLSSQLENGFEIELDSQIKKVEYAPMKLSDESSEEIVSNTRTLSVQGVNDIVAYYEDQVDSESSERIECEILSYLLDRGQVVSSVQARFKYLVTNIDYSQKSQSATLRISTSPTNLNETGVRFSSTLLPSMAGFE